MIDILPSLLKAGAGVGALLLVMVGLYGLSRLLPDRWRERAQTGVFLFPALVLLLGLVIPAILNLRYSFDNRNGVFSGLTNYKHIFTDRESRIVLRNTLWWALFVTVVSTSVGILIARLADGLRGEPIAKALIFLPTAISMVGAGIIWNFVYSPSDFGLLNSLWRLLPGDQGTQYFLQDRTFFGLRSSWIPGLNSFYIMVVVIWIQAGFATVVMSAALKGVPSDLVEAAKIDGATERQAFFRVVLPYVRGTVITVATTTVITVLKIFDIIQTMGRGGLFDTSTVANEMYRQAFPQNNKGLGSAWAVILFVLVLPIVFVNSWNQRRMREGN
ncbi:MAG TPA: sugar ABC transporter permease [Ilumatobacter sp.]|nr:sugar ABC transporter permease [Ilumatobacter sp.]